MMAFSAQVVVLDCATMLANTTGIYTVTVSSTPIELFSVSGDTILGSATLDGLYFTSGGNYIITATNPSVCIGLSSQFTVYDTTLKISFTSSLVKII